jgi:hypothetical protein
LTLICGTADSVFGYLPTSGGLERGGGYEAATSIFVYKRFQYEPGAGEKLAEDILSYCS